MRIAFAASLFALLPVAGPAQEAAKQGKSELRASARKAMLARDWQTATKALRRLVELDPKDAYSLANLGFALHMKGDIDAALECHLEAAKTPAVAATASYNAASAYAKKKDDAKALAWLAKADAAGFAGADQMANDNDLNRLKQRAEYRKAWQSIVGRAGPPKFQGWGATTARQSARLGYWSGRKNGGQLVINYGRPAWKPQYDKAIDSDQLIGTRWRFGENFWTTLDLNRPATIAGELVDPGYYYCALEKNRDGEILLVLLDPIEMRAKHVDAYQVAQTDGGIGIPLAHSLASDRVDRLTIDIQPDGKELFHGKLTVMFGKHRLTAAVTLRVD